MGKPAIEKELEAVLSENEDLAEENERLTQTISLLRKRLLDTRRRIFELEPVPTGRKVLSLEERILRKLGRGPAPLREITRATQGFTKDQRHETLSALVELGVISVEKSRENERGPEISTYRLTDGQ